MTSNQQDEISSRQERRNDSTDRLCREHQIIEFDLIKFLREINGEVRAGRIVGLAGFVVCREGKHTRFLVGGALDNAELTVGVLHRLINDALTLTENETS